MNALRLPWPRVAAPLLAVLALLWACCLPASAQQAVPAFSALVTDQAGMLDAAQRSKLDAVLTDYQTRTGSQIAVLLVKTTAPEQIEQYSIRVAEAWKLGRKGVDDGVLILVAKDNPATLRRLRIEAGRGVQGVLTDAKSKQILQDVIAPYFQKEQYYEGLVAGAGAVASLLNQEQFPAAPQQTNQGQQQQQGGGIGLLPMILIGIFIIGTIFRPRGSRLSRGGWGGNATGFILGTALGSLNRGGGGGFGGGGFGGGGGGFGGGGGGSFDGGGASGNW